MNVSMVIWAVSCEKVPIYIIMALMWSALQSVSLEGINEVNHASQLHNQLHNWWSSKKIYKTSSWHDVYIVHIGSLLAYLFLTYVFNGSFLGSQAALMLDSGRFNLQANTDKIQHLLYSLTKMSDGTTLYTTISTRCRVWTVWENPTEITFLVERKI